MYKLSILLCLLLITKNSFACETQPQDNEERARCCMKQNPPSWCLSPPSRSQLKRASRSASVPSAARSSEGGSGRGGNGFGGPKSLSFPDSPSGPGLSKHFFPGGGFGHWWHCPWWKYCCKWCWYICWGDWWCYWNCRWKLNCW